MTYSYIVGFGLQGLYFVILARMLSPGQFGQWSGAQATAIFMATFAAIGSGNVLVIDVSRNSASYSGAIGRALTTMAFMSPVLILFSAGLGLLVSPTFALLALLIGAAEIIGNKFAELAAQSAQANRQIHLSAHFNVISAAARLVVLCAAGYVFSWRLDAVGWAGTYACVSIASGAVMLVVAIRRYGGIRRVPFDFHRFRSGIFFSMGMASRIVYNDADKYILNLFRFVTVSGQYAAAYRLTNIAFAPLQALVYSSNVEMFTTGEKGFVALWSFIRRVSWVQIAGSVLITVVTFVCSPLIVVLLGASYAPSVAMLQVLCLLLPFQAIHYLFGDALMGVGRQGVRSTLQLCVALVSIVLNLALVPSFGWVASAWISVATAAALALLTVATFYLGFRAEMRLEVSRTR